MPEMLLRDSNVDTMKAVQDALRPVDTGAVNTTEMRGEW